LKQFFLSEFWVECLVDVGWDDDHRD